VVVALTAALIQAVARSSVEVWEDAAGVAGQGRALRGRAASLARENDEAYEKALRELRDPGDLAPALRDAAFCRSVLADMETALERAAWEPEPRLVSDLRPRLSRQR
jgi:hypothetical protein